MQGPDTKVRESNRAPPSVTAPLLTRNKYPSDNWCSDYHSSAILRMEWTQCEGEKEEKKRKKMPPPFHFQRFIIFLLLSGNEQMVINVTRESFLSACQVFHTDTLCSVFHRKWISSCGRLLFFPPPFLFFNPLLASFQFDLASKSVPL